MRYLFRLKYKMGKQKEDAIDLRREVNEVTGEELKRIGLQTEQKNLKISIFTIIKYEANGILNWKIKNNTDKEMYINSRIDPTGAKQRPVRKNEEVQLMNMLDEKIYFNRNNSDWDYLYFDRIKVTTEEEGVNNYKYRYITNENIRKENASSYLPSGVLSKSEDEPIDVNFDDLAEIMKATREEQPIKVNFLSDEDEEEKQRRELFNEENLQRLLMENMGNDEAEVKVESKNAELVKKKIIIDDEEEESYKSHSKSKSDFFLNEFDLNSIMERYKEDFEDYFENDENRCGNTQSNGNSNGNSNITRNNNNNTNNNNINNFNPLQRKEDYIKSVSKFGGVFNSNNKRPRQVSPHKASKEHEDFLSGFKTKRLKKASDNKELKIELNTTCAICLEAIKELANLDNCSHDFCKSCILEWSTKYTNLCPLCKKDFKKIIYYDKNKKKEIRVKKKKLVVEEEEGDFVDFEEESSDECMICGESSDFAHMLVCDSCHYNVCHTYCDGLNRIPSNDWYCRDCKEQSARDNLFREILIGEIAEDEDDEDYTPRILVDEDDKVLESLLDEGFILEEEDDRVLRRNRRASSNSNIRVNIHVNVNVDEGRRARGESRRGNGNRNGNSRNSTNNRNGRR